MYIEFNHNLSSLDVQATAIGGRKMSAQEEEQVSFEEAERSGSCEISAGAKLLDTCTRDKENLDKNALDKKKSHDEFLCHECKRSLASSPELINISGQPCRRWHPDCFKCIICREPMDKRQSCHVYEDQVVCRADYMRLKREINPVKCARCRWPIGASDWVRKAAQHIYHLACFNCGICSRQLNTGEQFIIGAANSNLSDDAGPIPLLCRLHFSIDHESTRACQDIASREHSVDCEPTQPEQPVKVEGREEEQDRLSGKWRRQNKRNFYDSQLAASTSSGGESTSMIIGKPHHHHNHEHPTLQFGTSIGKDLSIVTSQGHQNCSSSANTSPSTSSSSNNTTLLGCGGSELGGRATPTESQSGCGGSPSKSKRVRTTFTEDQLSILQTHFQIDSNPDGQDLERIATITGLSKRVTQVWFQNSRARQKKYMIKRKPMHAMTTLQGHGHHTIDLAAPRDEDDNDESSCHLRPFDELTQYNRRGDLFVAGLKQLQRRREALDGSTASSEQTSWQDGAGHQGGQTDEDRLSGISSLSSEANTTQGGVHSGPPSVGKS